MNNYVSNSKKELRRLYRKRTFYFVLTVILGICMLQFLWSSIYNCTRYLVLNVQISKLEQLNKEALERNKQLKNQLKVYSSYKGIEELARNNLKMVGKDEVLVLIKEKTSSH